MDRSRMSLSRVITILDAFILSKLNRLKLYTVWFVRDVVIVAGYIVACAEHI